MDSFDFHRPTNSAAAQIDFDTCIRIGEVTFSAAHPAGVASLVISAVTLNGSFSDNSAVEGSCELGQISVTLLKRLDDEVVVCGKAEEKALQCHFLYIPASILGQHAHYPHVVVEGSVGPLHLHLHRASLELAQNVTAHFVSEFSVLSSPARPQVRRRSRNSTLFFDSLLLISDSLSSSSLKAPPPAAEAMRQAFGIKLGLTLPRNCHNLTKIFTPPPFVEAVRQVYTSNILHKQCRLQALSLLKLSADIRYPLDILTLYPLSLLKLSTNRRFLGVSFSLAEALGVDAGGLRLEVAGASCRSGDFVVDVAAGSQPSVAPARICHYEISVEGMNCFVRCEDVTPVLSLVPYTLSITIN
jgi:hypothetical protein